MIISFSNKQYDEIINFSQRKYAHHWVKILEADRLVTVFPDFLDLWVRLLFKGGNYLKEETINFLLFVYTIWIVTKYISTYFISPITFWLVLYVLFIWLKCDYYSREETIQGRKLLIIRRFLMRKLFKGGKYSREETIRGNTVCRPDKSNITVETPV